MEAVSFCEAEGVEVILGDWTSEDEHRQTGLNALKDHGFQHVHNTDGDGVIEPALLDHLIRSSPKQTWPTASTSSGTPTGKRPTESLGQESPSRPAS